jgi:hypothetical protein
LATPVLFSTFASNTGSVAFSCAIGADCSFPFRASQQWEVFSYPVPPTPHLCPGTPGVPGDFDPFLYRTVRGVLKKFQNRNSNIQEGVVVFQGIAQSKKLFWGRKMNKLKVTYIYCKWKLKVTFTSCQQLIN